MAVVNLMVVRLQTGAFDDSFADVWQGAMVNVEAGLRYEGLVSSRRSPITDYRSCPFASSGPGGQASDTG